MTPDERRSPGGCPSATPRLRFRWWSADDLELAVALWGDPRVTAMIDARGELTRGQVRERLERELDHGQRHGVQYWPFFDRRREPDGADAERSRFAGCCGLKPHPTETGLVEMGFHVRSDRWGRGYATEAARAVIAHARDALGLPRIVAGHHPQNHASRRVLEKLGFTWLREELFEGTGLVHPLYVLELGGTSDPRTVP